MTSYLEFLTQHGRKATPGEYLPSLHGRAQLWDDLEAQTETEAPALAETGPETAGGTTAGQDGAALPLLSELRDRIQRGMDRGEAAAAVLCDLAGTVAAKLAAATDGPPSALSSWQASVRAYYLDSSAQQSVLYGQAMDALETKQERARADTLAKLRKRVDTQQHALAALQRQTGQQSDLLTALEAGDLERAEKALKAMRH